MNENEEFAQVISSKPDVKTISFGSRNNPYV